MQAFFITTKGDENKVCDSRVCGNCKWLEPLPFADENVCTCDESEYADCPCDNPNNDTCNEFCEKDN